jgi:gliding motility-associated protein GldE
MPDLLLIASPLQITMGVLGIVFLLMASALVSGSEVAYFSLTHQDADQLSQDNRASSRRILWLKEHPQRLLATILISNNFVNIAIVLLSEIVVSSLLPTTVTFAWADQMQAGWSWLQGFSDDQLATGISFLLTVVGATFLLVLFGEVAPKVYARYNSIQLARTMSGPLTVLMEVFSPLSSVLVRWSRRLEKRLADRPPIGVLTSREEIDEAIELAVSGEINGEQDIDILKRIVKFSDVNVRQIMRSRVDVVALDLRQTYAEVLAIIRESGYSRFPVYEQDADNVTGILYVKDLLGHLNQDEDFSWQDLVRTSVLFVPESKMINDLLREFQQQHLHMAIVVDEYGGTAGIVTLEDVLEEVIGDIQDEFDDEPEVIYQKIDDQNFVFDGKTLLNDVCRIVGISTDTFDAVKGESDSLAGLILEMLGAMPQNGQKLQSGLYQFKIVSVSKRRIERILLTLPTDPEESS